METFRLAVVLTSQSKVINNHITNDNARSIQVRKFILAYFTGTPRLFSNYNAVIRLDDGFFSIEVTNGNYLFIMRSNHITRQETTSRHHWIDTENVFRRFIIVQINNKITSPLQYNYLEVQLGLRMMLDFENWLLESNAVVPLPWSGPVPALEPNRTTFNNYATEANRTQPVPSCLM